MENFNSCWKRIDEIMWHYRFRKISEFARHLGLKRSENLYQIKRGKHRISFALATLNLQEVSGGQQMLAFVRRGRNAEKGDREVTLVICRSGESE